MPMPMLTEASHIPSEGEALHSHCGSNRGNTSANNSSTGNQNQVSSSNSSSSSGSVKASAAVVLDKPHGHEHTNSVNRSFSDLDNASFLFYAFGLCALRTAAQQPMNLALARKQTSSAYAALSTRAVLNRIYKCEGGFRGLNQGMAAMTVGCALSEVVYLYLFELWRERLPMESSASRDAAAGYGADALCRLVHIPLSIIAFRQMTAASQQTSRLPSLPKSAASAVSASDSRRLFQGRFTGLWGARRDIAAQSTWRTLSSMYRENGIKTVFAGYGTTLAVGCQWSAMWWALYGSFKGVMYTTAGPLLIDNSTINDNRKSTTSHSIRDSDSHSGWTWLQRALPSWCLAKDDNLLVNSAASVVTGGTTAILFNPYLVIRTNLQTTPMATLRSATQNIYKTRGLKGFYSGLWLNVTACVVDGTLASASYEYAKLWSDRTRRAGQETAATVGTPQQQRQQEVEMDAAVLVE